MEHFLREEKNKKLLRKQILSKRDQLCQESILQKSVEIWKNLTQTTIYQKADIIFTYVSAKTEAQTLPFFEKMWETGKSAGELVEQLGLKQLNNDDEILKMVLEAISNFPQSVADYKNGKTSAIGFLVGQVMKNSKGKANPQKVSLMLKEELEK